MEEMGVRMRISLLARKAMGISALALVVSLSATAHAADAAAAAEADSSGAPLQDIVVTAERTNTTLQKATLSVTAVTADTLTKNNVTEIGGLNGLVPGLVVSSANGGERNISIRGIGLGTPENPQTQSGVSYHIDGVYIFNSIAANAAFVDVGQIEVLRGPQGTMYGQGSTGGTINVVSVQPDASKISGYMDAGYGNYSYTKADGALNIPITDTLAVRGAVQYLKHNGYAHATDVPGQPNYALSNANDISGKASLKWTPNDTVTVLLSTIQYRGNNNASEQKNVLDPNPDPREVTQDYPGKSYVRTQLYYGVIKFNLGGAIFSSITSYQKVLSKQSWDGDGLNTTLFPQFQGINTFGALYDHIALWQQTTKSFTQEYNLASDNTGPLKWIVGGVYLHSNNSSYINEYSSSTGDGQNAALPMNTAFNNTMVELLTYGESSAIKRESFAAYGQGTYKLTDKLSITAGLRFNHDKYQGLSDSLSGGAMPTVTSGAYLQPKPTVSSISQKVTWKAAIDYDLTPQNMVYASYTRGYKPGGINTSASKNGSAVLFGNPLGVQGTFKQESVDAFEVGSKNRFFNNTLQLNVSGFYYIYKNMQFIDDDPILFSYGIDNGPRAHIYGAEAEADWHLTDHFQLEGNLSLLHGKFVGDKEALDPTNATAAQVAAGFAGTGGFFGHFFPAYQARLTAYRNINGNDVPSLPTVQGSVAGSWTGEVGPGELMLRAQYLYRGGFKSNVFQLYAVDATPHYQQVNLFANYDIKGTGFSISATVTNLFNVDGINSRFTDPYGTHQVFNTYIAPRQVIGAVKYTF
jgi:iron complex outermembrane receptor protein